MAYLVDPQRVPKSFMGIIRADLHLENSEDRALFEHGHIAEDDILSLVVAGMVDTGARMLHLPKDLVDELGLCSVVFQPDGATGYLWKQAGGAGEHVSGT